MAKLNPYLKQAIKEAREKERAEKKKQDFENRSADHALQRKMRHKEPTEMQRRVKAEKEQNKNKYKDWDKW